MALSWKVGFFKVFGRVGALSIISLGLGFLTSVIIARTLGPEGYGKYTLVTAIMSLLALPLYAGMPALLVREVVKLREDRNWGLFEGLRRRVSQVIWGGAGLLFLVIFIIWYYSGASANQSIISLVLLALPLAPLMALNGTRAAVLRGFQKFFQSQLPESVVQPMMHLALLMGLLAVSALKVESALISLMASIFVAFTLGHWFLRRELAAHNIRSEPKYQTKQWLKSLAPFTAIAAIYILNSQVAIVLLGWFSVPDQVGFLRIADRVAQLIVLSLTVVNLILSPQIAQYAKAEDYKRVEMIARHSARVALVFAAPIALILMVWGKPIIGLTFGEAFSEPVWIPLLVLCGGQLINVFFGSVGVVLNMSGHERDTLIGVGFGLTVNLVLSVILIPFYGAVGAAISIASGMLAWSFYMARCVTGKLAIRVTPF